LNRPRFIAVRQEDWYRFRSLVERLEATPLRQVSGEDLAEMSRLFRALCYDLSVVRSRDWGRELEGRLNDLVVRGHNLLYRAPPGRLRAVVSFVLVGFPRLLRANAGYFWAACALFLVPGLAAAISIALEPTLAERILPRQMLDMMEAMHSESFNERALFAGAEAARTGYYVLNNVSIAFKAWALGILLGLGSAYVLVYNGLIIGAVTGYLVARGHAEPFFSFVIAHGAFELTAIVVAGAAGLVVGRALVHPGHYTRMDALRRRGLVSTQLALGAAAMLLVAAVIEGVWSPMGLPPRLKLGAGALFWMVVVLYLLLAGRRHASRLASGFAGPGRRPPGVPRGTRGEREASP